MAPKWSTQGPTRIAHCLLSTKKCQIYHLHLRIRNGRYSPRGGGATIFSNTHIWVWKSDTPKSPLVYHQLLPKRKKTSWSKSPHFSAQHQRFFCACTQKDLNPVLRLRPRPKHQLGGVEGIDQHHLAAEVFNGFWMFLGTEIGRFFIEIWGNQKRGYPKIDGYNGKSFWNGWFGGTPCQETSICWNAQNWLDPQEWMLSFFNKFGCLLKGSKESERDKKWHTIRGWVGSPHFIYTNMTIDISKSAQISRDPNLSLKQSRDTQLGIQPTEFDFKKSTLW